MKCLNCGGLDVIKKGRRKTKFGFRQFYYCKDCEKGFVGSKLPHKTYGPKVIASAINCYNLGNTLETSAKITNRKYKVKVSKSSVSQWLKELKSICTYNKIRPEIAKNYGKEILVSKTFKHNDLAYNFKYHSPKLEMLCGKNNFSSLATYIKNLNTGCPEFFNDIENRSSQIKTEIKIEKKTDYNNACRLTSFALKSCDINSERHSTVENFMLINDSSTIACEVPIWLWEKNLDMGISGHIDILQIRSNKIYILDFKPDAWRENDQKVASQLFWYASGLSFRTSIPLKDFVCAWFDNYNYYEFNPKEAKIRFPNSKWRSDKKQISEEKATDFVSRAGNGSWKESGPDWKELKGKLAADFGRLKDTKISKI
jgi:transposase-like protein